MKEASDWWKALTREEQLYVERSMTRLMGNSWSIENAYVNFSMYLK
jgi:hypothetical protein